MSPFSKATEEHAKRVLLVSQTQIIFPRKISLLLFAKAANWVFAVVAALKHQIPN